VLRRLVGVLCDRPTAIKNSRSSWSFAMVESAWPTGGQRSIRHLAVLPERPDTSAAQRTFFRYQKATHRSIGLAC
jgi:hypothetical protein